MRLYTPGGCRSPPRGRCLQGNCVNALGLLPEQLDRQAVNSKHCIIDFQNGSTGFEVPASSSLWLTDLILVNAGNSSADTGTGLLSNAHSPSSAGDVTSRVIPWNTSSLTAASPSEASAQAQGMTWGDDFASGTFAWSTISRNISSVGTGATLPRISPSHMSGGAVHMASGSISAGGKLYAQRVIFFKNHAVNGGAIGLNDFSVAELVDCVFDSNSASGHGGAPHLAVLTLIFVNRTSLMNCPNRVMTPAVLLGPCCISCICLLVPPYLLSCTCCALIATCTCRYRSTLDGQRITGQRVARIAGQQFCQCSIFCVCPGEQHSTAYSDMLEC